MHLVKFAAKSKSKLSLKRNRKIQYYPLLKLIVKLLYKYIRNNIFINNNKSHWKTELGQDGEKDLHIC